MALWNELQRGPCWKRAIIAGSGGKGQESQWHCSEAFPAAVAKPYKRIVRPELTLEGTGRKNASVSAAAWELKVRLGWRRQSSTLEVVARRPALDRARQGRRIYIIWRAGDANDASIKRWRCVVDIGMDRGIYNEVSIVVDVVDLNAFFLKELSQVWVVLGCLPVISSRAGGRKFQKKKETIGRNDALAIFAPHTRVLHLERRTKSTNQAGFESIKILYLFFAFL